MPCTATPTALPEVLLLQSPVHNDARGFFSEIYNQRDFARATGLDVDFVQDNLSRSLRGVLRGLHYQIAPHAQGKLVRVLRGAVFDVTVDMRASSPRFGRWMGTELSADAPCWLWIPPGFAHGFFTISPHAEVLYKTTSHWCATHERALRWNDPALGIAWPLGDCGQPLLSNKDAQAPLLADAQPC